MTQVPTSVVANTIASEARSRRLGASTRAYFQSRLRLRLFDFVMTKFREEAALNGLTRAELGRRIGKRPEVITRLLGAPGNWTLETVSDLLMGISGQELMTVAASPFDAPAQNCGYQDVLERNGQSGDGQGGQTDLNRFFDRNDVAKAEQHSGQQQQ